MIPIPKSQSHAASGPSGIKLLQDGDGAIQLRNLLGDGGDFQAVHLRNHQALARLSILRWCRRLEHGTGKEEPWLGEERAETCRNQDLQFLKVQESMIMIHDAQYPQFNL